MPSPTSPSSSCDFPMLATKMPTCTVRRMRSGRFSCLLRRKRATGRSRSHRVHDPGRDELTKRRPLPAAGRGRSLFTFAPAYVRLAWRRFSANRNAPEQGAPVFACCLFARCAQRARALQFWRRLTAFQNSSPLRRQCPFANFVRKSSIHTEQITRPPCA